LFLDSEQNLEIDSQIARRAEANFRKAGLQQWITTSIGDARQLVKEVAGPIDFVFIDRNAPNAEDMAARVDVLLRLSHDLLGKPQATGPILRAVVLFLRVLARGPSRWNLAPRSSLPVRVRRRSPRRAWRAGGKASCHRVAIAADRV
jgi:23S rRNA G2445 N2-methylase RlmL